MCPRLPVDGKKVVEHRVTLGTYERQQLDTFVTGMTVRNVGTPMVELLSDVSALTVLAGLLETLGIIDITGWIERNTWADEIYRGILDQAYATYPEALAALEAAAAAVNEASAAAAAAGAAVEELVKIDFHVKAWVWVKTSIYDMREAVGIPSGVAIY